MAGNFEDQRISRKFVSGSHTNARVGGGGGIRQEPPFPSGKSHPPASNRLGGTIFLPSSPFLNIGGRPFRIRIRGIATESSAGSKGKSAMTCFRRCLGVSSPACRLL